MVSGLTGAAKGATTAATTAATTVAATTARAATSTVTDTAKVAGDMVGGATGNKMLWPAVIGAIALGGILAFSMCNKTEVPTVAIATPEPSTSTPAPAATPEVAMASPEASPAATPEAAVASPEAAMTFPVADSSVKLPDGTELKAAKGGIEEQWVAFVNSTDPVSKDKWFNFDRVLFDTGKATLRPESNDQIENAAKVLKAFPKLKIKVGGYTDNVGKPESNMKLSQERADVMKAAIEKAGAPAGSIEKAEGYGETNPIASNDTDAGKQQNRRIAIRVTAK